MYDGQEGVLGGIESVLTKEDPLIVGHRCHCSYLKRGGNPREVFAEAIGKITGSSNGKCGGYHYYNKENNLYGGWTIVGSEIATGTGLGFGLKYQNKKNVCLNLYGDGAAN